MFLMIKIKFWIDYDLTYSSSKIPNDLLSFIRSNVGTNIWSIAYKKAKFKVEPVEGSYYLIKYPEYLRLVE